MFTTTDEWVQTDLGAPVTGGTPAKLLRVQGSTNGRDFNGLSAPEVFRFTDADSRRAAVALGVTTRYVRVLSSTPAARPAGRSWR